MTALNEKLSEFKPQDPAVYAGINNDFLLSFTLAELIRIGIPATFEALVVAAFKLFPESFSLIGFSEYPDAARLNRTLLHSRPNYQNLIVGNAKSGFTLTKKGKLKAEEVAEALQGKVTPSTKKTTTTENAVQRTFTGGADVATIEGSQLYKDYVSGNTEKLNPYSLWFLLDVAPNTQKDILKEIIKKYRISAEVAKRPDLVKFLDWIEKDRYRNVFR